MPTIQKDERFERVPFQQNKSWIIFQSNKFEIAFRSFTTIHISLVKAILTAWNNENERFIDLNAQTKAVEIKMHYGEKFEKN